MSRIGSTIRSAKMKAMTPPKLMPLFHNTAASGMFADRADERDDRDQRADQRSPELGQEWMVGQEEALPKLLRHPCCQCAGDQKPANDVDPDRGPIHHEIMSDRGAPLIRRY